MKTFLVKRGLSALVVGLFAGMLLACSGNRKEASSTAQAFLQAYYVDLDFNKALTLCDDFSHGLINDQAQMTALNPYAQEEVPDIVVLEVKIDPSNEDVATCTYTYNRMERTLPLRKLGGKWVVYLNGKTVETAGSQNDFIELSSEGSNGFAVATSGEIKYKKRNTKENKKNN